jgi:hypothetical protein
MCSYILSPHEAGGFRVGGGEGAPAAGDSGDESRAGEGAERREAPEEEGPEGAHRAGRGFL